MSAEPVPVQEADDRPEVYEENGVIIIRASAMGGCIRNMVAAKKGIRAVPFSEKSLQRMNEGVIHEPHILAHLATQGWETIDTQEVLELEIAGGKIIIRGHSDGTVRNLLRRETRVVEVKAQGAAVWEKWRKHQWAEFRRYAYQLSIYMAITGLPGMFATKNRDTGEIDISYWDEAPISVTQLKARAIKIATAVELPECDPGGGVSLFGCSRYFIHTGEHEIDPFTGLEVKKGSTTSTSSVPEDKVAAFEELARQYQEAKDAEAVAEKAKKEIGALLLTFLSTNNLKKGVSEEWVVNEVSRKDTRLDQKGLKAKYPDIAAEFTVESTSRYVSVKRREEVS